MAIRWTRIDGRHRGVAPAVVGALALVVGAAHGASTAQVTAAPRTTTVIEDQSFEGAFPPPKWQVADIGVPPGQFIWARTTCTAAPGGGSASVWSIGGGAVGGGLGCAGTYDSWSESDLIYGPIDATGFDGGIDLALHLKLDLHRDSDFQMCVTDPGAESGLSCFIAGAGITQLAWNFIDPPAEFPGTAGHDNVYVVLRFRDRDPDVGSPHQGAWVDRVVIRGISGGGQPSPTATATTAPSATATTVPATTAAPSPTSTPTRTASSSPTPTRTGTPPPSATGVASPTPTASATPTTAAPTVSPPPSATTRPSATPTATGTPVPGATTPAAPTTAVPSPTVTLPPPPTIDLTVTAAASATSASTPPSPVPTTVTPTGPTPTVVVAPDEWFVYLPFGVVNRAR